MPAGLRSLLGAFAAAMLAVSCSGGGGQLDRGDATTGSTTGSPTVSAVKPVSVERLHSPRTPAAAARVLAEVETGLREAHGDPESLGRRQQLAYRALSAHPGWTTRVLDAVPRSVRAAVQSNIEAGEALTGLTGQAAAGFPHWEIRRPESSTTLRSFYDEAEQATGIPWAYLAAIHLVETRMGRIHGLSSAGAQGPMQFIPETWASYGKGDIESDHDAIQAAGRYLASRGGPADMDRALFSYNNDERYVRAVRAYASVMLADPRAYDGYHAWRVFYATTNGTFLLPEGFRA